MRSKYTKELLTELINKANSWADVCRALNIKPSTGAQSYVTKQAKTFGIDTSHFQGQGWSKGKTFLKLPLQNYLIKDSKAQSNFIRKRLIKDGIKEEKCECCGLDTWRGFPIPLELDHINEDHSDNRLENLQILCSNCQALKHKSRYGGTRQTR